MIIQPTHLRLEEAFERSDVTNRDAFLARMGELLAAGLAEAVGRPNGPSEQHRPPGPSTPRLPISAEQWRDLVLRFDLNGCAAPAVDTESALDTAMWRRTGHPNLKDFDASTLPVVWLDLLIRVRRDQPERSERELQELIAEALARQAETDRQRAAGEAEKPATAASRESPNRGGGYPGDIALVDEMRRSICEAADAGRPIKPSRAALAVVDRADGNSLVASKRDRLVRKYSERYPDNL